MGIDWTQVLVVVLPYVVGHAFGALQMWMRMRHDAELGRSLRPKAPKRRPTLNDLENPNASQLDDPNGPKTDPQRKLPPKRDS